MVIFTTAHFEYAVEGFNLNAVDYLLKPISYDRFIQALEKVKQQQSITTKKIADNNFILLRVDYSLVKVRLEDIILIEGLDDYLQIYLEGQKKLVPRMTMKTILSKLPPSDFIRVHRSFIVPLKRIEQVRNKTIYINEREIRLGASFENSFFNVFKDKSEA